jgi:hypothetical protein
MPNFTRFTGLSPAIARTVFAPVKLLGAVLLAIGLGIAAAGPGGRCHHRGRVCRVPTAAGGSGPA